MPHLLSPQQEIREYAAGLNDGGVTSGALAGGSEDPQVGADGRKGKDWGQGWGPGSAIHWQ